MVGLYAMELIYVLIYCKSSMQIKVAFFYTRVNKDQCISS